MNNQQRLMSTIINKLRHFVTNKQTVRRLL
nr:MAG TPA: hypothetical protein [Caudoviricetes sp.]